MTATSRIASDLSSADSPNRKGGMEASGTRLRVPCHKKW